MTTPSSKWLTLHFAAIPPKPVKKGDHTQEKKLVLNMGPVGSYDTTNTYTYDGKDGKLDKIKVDTKLKYSAPGAPPPPGRYRSRSNQATQNW